MDECMDGWMDPEPNPNLLKAQKRSALHCIIICLYHFYPAQIAKQCPQRTDIISINYLVILRMNKLLILIIIFTLELHSVKWRQMIDPTVLVHLINGDHYTQRDAFRNVS